MTDQQTADARKVAFKAELLVKQLGLSAALAGIFIGRVHMVKAADRPGRPHRIQCADGGWIEIDPETRHVRTWGPGRTRREMAAAIAAERGTYDFADYLEPTATAAAPGAPRRAAPVLSDDNLKAMADGWRKRGFADIEMDDSGVWVALDGGTRLYDVGTRVTIYGPVSDEAITALVGKSKDEWDSQLRLFGTWEDEDRERVWLECQRSGVALTEYKPSAELIAKWEAERDADGPGEGQALLPDDDPAPTSAGPMSPMTGDGSATEPDAKVPVDKPELDLSAFDRQAASLDRRQGELEQRQRMTIKERMDFLQREKRLDLRAAQAEAFREQDELRQAEARIAEAREILDRARSLAVEKGLDYESAIAVAKAEHLAEKEHGYQPRSGLRR